MHEVNMPKIALRGPSFAPKRAGSLHPDGGPTGMFRYKGEEFIAIMVMPYQWKQMVQAMKMPELAGDPRFNTPRARRDNNEALKHIIEDWLAGFPTRDAAVEALERGAFPARRFSRCTRPWRIRICASAERSGGSGPRSASSTFPGCR